MDAGYERYRRFFETAPQLVAEWHDSETDAVGWLAINSLLNGAAGGGTRMKKGATRDEAVFLAKTMEIKFRVCGPVMGGAKSVINFDPGDPRKEGVLRRWFRSIGPYLKQCYGTAGDLGVDEITEVIPLTTVELQLQHPQEGVVRGLARGEEVSLVLERMKEGIELDVPLSDMPNAQYKLADLITGYGLAASIDAYFQHAGDTLRGKRVAIEGFGAVGGSGAYYLQKLGATTVAAVTRSRDTGLFRWQVDPQGLDVADLMQRRELAGLPSGSPEGESADPFWAAEADVFVPAATSHSLSPDRLETLQRNGVSVIACGANNPFDAELGKTEIQRQADENFAIIPDFIANSGIARAFAYLMTEGSRTNAEAIFDDIDRHLRGAVAKLLAEGPADRGLLGRAYGMYVP